MTEEDRFALTVGPTLSTQVDVSLAPGAARPPVARPARAGGADLEVLDPPRPVEPVAPELPDEPLIDRVLRVLRNARRAGPPGWLIALAIFAATRGITYAFLQGASRFQTANRFTDAHPDYLTMVGHWWDAGRYSTIATGGYPLPIPRYPTGDVMRNQWAFYPAYPRAVRELMIHFGWSWSVAGVVLSLVCGALAAMVMHSLISRVAGRSLATWTVVLFCVFPSSPVLQFTYTESLATLLLVTTLWCLQRRWYLAAVPVVLIVGVSRPIGAPIAAVVGVHLLVRVWQRVRWAEPLRWVSLAALILLSLVSAFSAVEWPILVGKLTGDPNGYAETMAAWRTNGKIIPVQPWIDRSGQLLGLTVGPLVLVALGIGYAWWMCRRRTVRVLGADLMTWCIAYSVYLLLVLDPTTSTVRYLLLLFPLGTLLAAASPARAYRWAVALAFVALQLVWLTELWMLNPMRIWPP